MPISTKLECAHCGCTLKTAKVMVPGAKVRCPRCKGVFNIQASDDNGLVETIPIEGGEEPMELDAASAELAAVAPVRKKATRGADAPAITGPGRAPGPVATAGKKIELSGQAPSFRGGRSMFAAIGVSVAVVAVGAFVWWYVGQVKELDTVGKAAVEQRTAVIEKAAAPPALAKVSPKPTTAPPTLAVTKPPPPRAIAPSTAEIGDLVVGIATARIGLVDLNGARNVLSLGLRITNKSANPMKHQSWSRSEIKVVLRDRYGNFYNRIPQASPDEVEIKSGETVTETLVFEPTAFGSEVTLDLPVPGGGKGFEFLIPSGFIDRGGPPTSASAGQIPNPAAPLGVAPLMPKTTAAQPAKTEEPATDQKLAAKIRGDFKEALAEINRRRLGMSSNDSVTFRRRETAKAVKKLAKDNELTEDEVKRIVGLKG